MSEHIQELLRCPVCKTELSRSGADLACANSECGRRYPVVDGVPVLINDDNSLFSIDDFVQHRSTFFKAPPKNRLKRALLRLIPDASLNVKGKENYAHFAELLLQQSDAPRVLILGGSVQGKCMERLLAHPQIEFVDSDIAFGPRTRIICDAHDIPFADGSFDGVVAQAVLEHVADPYRCVDEIHRVLKKDALVYAETPFMQQMHGAPYDFTRFTIQGYRRLFRKFEEIECATCTGPGMAFLWSYKYFLISFARSRVGVRAAEMFACLTGWYLKYLDYFLIHKPGSIAAASGYYFLGRRSSHTATDRELIERYRDMTRGR